MDPNQDKTHYNHLVNLVNEKLNFINASIYELNEFSNNDFKTLSSTFKKYYEDIMLIYNNINNSFKDVINVQRDHIVDNTIKVRDVSNDVIHELLIVVREFQAKQREYNQGKNLLFMHINNLRQNVKTYELLVANITLGKKIVKTRVKDSGSTDPFSRDVLRDFIKRGTTYVERLKLNDELLSIRYYNDYAESFLKLENPYFNNNAIESLVASTIQHIEQGNQRLENTIDSATRAFSSIVTKLQYQDIISQSIQHILSSHLNIIEQTSDFKKLTSDEIESILKKIKFMTLLQASQLMQVNKDYQDSIKVIVEKFESLSSNVLALLELSDMLKAKQHLNETFWTDITPSLTSFVQIINLSINALGRFKEASLLLSQDIESLNGLSKVIGGVKTQVDALSSIIDKDKNSPGNENELLKILLKDVNTEVAAINELIASISNNARNTTTTILRVSNLDILRKSLLDVYELLNNQLNSIESNNQKLKSNLKDNTNKGMQVSQNLKNSIHEIRYYNQFEHTAEAIINELEHLKSEILFDELDISGIDTSDLKNIYTVRTEHTVLNNLVNNSASTNDDEEGEIEFF